MLSASLPNTTLRQKAYSIIQRKLLSGEIRVGDLVSEMALAEEIGISRTPVREAIGQLQIEGLFDKVPRVGTLVRLPCQRELSEMFGVREALESFVAAVAVNQLSEEQFAQLEHHQNALRELMNEATGKEMEILDEAKLVRFFEADIGFHATIIDTNDNQHVLKIINEFRIVQRVFEYGRMAYNMELVASAAREHGQILEALKAGDSVKARNAMALHVRSSCANAMKRFDTVDGALKADDVLLLDKNARSHSRLKQRPRRRNAAINSTAS